METDAEIIKGLEMKNKKLVERNDELQKEKQDLQATVDELYVPLAFEYKEGRKTLLIKLGSKERGWFPSGRHFAAAQKQFKACMLDKKFNIILYHYAIETQIVE